MGVTPFVLAALLAQAPAESASEGNVVEVEAQLVGASDPKLLEGASTFILIPKGQPPSVRAVRRSIERLMETGRFSDVEAWAEPVEGGVKVIFAVKPRQSITELYVEGNATFSDADVLAPTRLTPESEFYAERLAQARDQIVQLYRRRGFRDVQVEVKVTEGEVGTDVGFIVLEGLPTRLQGVVVAGDPGLSMPRLLHELDLELNAVLDLTAIDVKLERLRETLRVERFYRARVDAAQVEAGGVLVLPISAGPRIVFGFTGNRAFPSSALSRVIAWDGAEVLDGTVTERLARQLSQFYRFRGFHGVRVSTHERAGANPRERELSFAIDEGPQVVMREVAFSGNHGIRAEELQKVLTDVMKASAPGSDATEVHAIDDPLSLEGRVQPPRYGDLPAPAPETVLVEAAYLEAARAMGRLYRDRGYARAKVRLQSVDLTPAGASAMFDVQEGPQTLLRTIAFEGGPPGFPETSPATMAVGDPLSDRGLDEWVKAMKRDLERRGFLFGEVTAGARFSDDETKADLRFEVRPGPLVTVGKIFVRGNLRTAESVILAQVTFKEGEPLNPNGYFASQRALLDLGIFKTVDVRPRDPDSQDPVRDIVVEVREEQTFSGKWVAGYFYAEGFRTGVDGEFPNLAGRAIRIEGRARFNLFFLSGLALSRQVDTSELKLEEQIGIKGNISASNRGLLPVGIGTRLDIVGERTFRQSYRFTRFAGGPSLDWNKGFFVPFLDVFGLVPKPKLTLQLQYEIEWTRVSTVNTIGSTIFPLLRADQERLRFLFGTFWLHTVRFAPTLDLRDDPVQPRKGLLIQSAVETTLPIETVDEVGTPVPVEFLKLSSTVSAYLPVRRLVIAASLRGGIIVPLIQDSVTPPVKRFFLGGSTSLRGFREDGLIAEDQRQSYRQQVNDCKALATRIGCTKAAITLLSRNEILSQGGELFMLGKVELRFPAVGPFDMGLFFEAGNLWLDAPTAVSLRPVTGAGLRYLTPIGPLALDFGINLAPDNLVNEPAFNVHFNIGLF